MLDGFILLLGDKDSNLGWRILAKAQLPEEEFAQAIQKSISDPSRKFYDFVSSDYKKKVKETLASVRKIVKGRVITEDDCNSVFRDFGIDPFELSRQWLRDRLESDPVKAGTFRPARSSNEKLGLRLEQRDCLRIMFLLLISTIGFFWTAEKKLPIRIFATCWSPSLAHGESYA